MKLNLKRIKLNSGATILYKEVAYEDDFGYIIESVEFYDKIITHSIIRKYIFFGNYIKNKEPNLIFTIHESLRDANYAKDWWLDKITEKYNNYINKLNRIEEINQNKFL